MHEHDDDDLPRYERTVTDHAPPRTRGDRGRVKHVCSRSTVYGGVVTLTVLTHSALEVEVPLTIGEAWDLSRALADVAGALEKAQP